MNIDFASISSVILFAISIFTFITSQITKAQNDGKILERIEQTQRDIKEIKESLKEKSNDVIELKLATESQEQRLLSLTQHFNDLEKRVSNIEAKG